MSAEIMINHDIYRYFLKASTPIKGLLMLHYLQGGYNRIWIIQK